MHIDFRVVHVASFKNARRDWAKQGLDAVLGGRFEQAGVAEAMQG